MLVVTQLPFPDMSGRSVTWGIILTSLQVDMEGNQWFTTDSFL